MSSNKKATGRLDEHKRDIKAPDDQLIALAIAGDSGATTMLDQRYRPQLERIAESWTGNPELAEEIAHVTLLKAFKNLQAYESGSNFPAWIFSIARNAMRDWHRREAKHAANQTLFEQRIDTSSSAWAISAEELFELAKVVLSPMQYKILWLRYVGQHSNDEIAKRVKRSNSAVRTQLSRAKRILRNSLNEEKLDG